jgi:hypothetical protein
MVGQPVHYTVSGTASATKLAYKVSMVIAVSKVIQSSW